jgi:hypothetical protein
MTDYPKQTGEHSWIIQVKGHGGKEEELFIELPPDALNQVGWDIGDTIIWEDLGNGSFKLKKKIEEQG